MELGETQQVRRWIHDIIFHQEYFEGEIIELSKEQIIDILCNVTKSFYFDEK
ncbi:hypothetical protein BD31_I1307 [Candidatus Nitrosopumilus salaria BD31]|uniref:Uncharacterized protein n=1 Tax=Candidatus Nitrosopumilus salarius BD31 TaxID=859350 RepID=I3D2W2_9ARCH|nr:hypothetical protein [Candidatus Nitrosopumilus salaria]EIJ66055.1 hypothetical protein BD31_I1307 [Candidatus Nitrosopumilus salaria BD31]